jgi:hypothetical protein
VLENIGNFFQIYEKKRSGKDTSSKKEEKSKEY